MLSAINTVCVFAYVVVPTTVKLPIMFTSFNPEIIPLAGNVNDPSSPNVQFCDVPLVLALITTFVLAYNSADAAVKNNAV